MDWAECDNTFLNYDQSIVMDMHYGSLKLNSKGGLNKPNKEIVQEINFMDI